MRVMAWAVARSSSVDASTPLTDDDARSTLFCMAATS